MLSIKEEKSGMLYILRIQFQKPLLRTLPDLGTYPALILPVDPLSPPFYCIPIPSCQLLMPENIYLGL